MSSITKKKTVRLQWITAVLSFMTGIILIIATISGEVAAWIDSLFSSKIETPMVEIATPEGLLVPASFPVSGEFKGIPADGILWAMKFNYGNKKWYPQERSCAELDGGKFNCGSMTLGRRGQPADDKVYTIAVARVSATAVSEFGRYYREVVFKDRDNPNYAGMSTLPSGVQILGQKEVTRSS